LQATNTPQSLSYAEAAPNEVLYNFIMRDFFRATVFFGITPFPPAVSSVFTNVFKASVAACESFE
jgi:hypothetical protein